MADLIVDTYPYFIYVLVFWILRSHTLIQNSWRVTLWHYWNILAFAQHTVAHRGYMGLWSCDCQSFYLSSFIVTVYICWWGTLCISSFLHCRIKVWFMILPGVTVYVYLGFPSRSAHIFYLFTLNDKLYCT